MPRGHFGHKREGTMQKSNKAPQFALAYVAGTIIAGIFHLLRAVGLVQLIHGERIPRWKSSLLIAVNHPSLVEPFFIPSLFVREWIWSPIKWGPWSTPDRTNLETKFAWFFWVGGARNIPVPRKRAEGETNRQFLHATYRALRRMGAILRIGGRIILFPEGGRTWRIPENERLRSPKDNELRPLRKRTGEIVVAARPTVLPISVSYPWVKDQRRGWLPIRIKIGHPVRFEESDPQVVARKLEAMLLALADEGED
ncbi:1-acyl-sn-glycerol-3-phosphate acyltransferase [Candidatus Parcubacteria bacterium]|nr:MAG: 1-acyl-sn-glycerol-3-phosphate acyltransferase [Candidatus Parcubacteria bacterium]